MKELIKQLKEKIEQFEIETVDFKKAKKSAMEALDDSADSIVTLVKDITELKEKIEPLILAEFKKTKKKKLYGGLGVQEKNVLTYSEAKALEWAMGKQLCLSLQVKPFEKLASTQNLDFVTQSKIPKVTYPKIIEIPENDTGFRIESDGSGGIGTTQSEDALKISSEESEILTINLDGNLAPPGTVSPDTLLHVKSDGISQSEDMIFSNEKEPINET